MHLKHRILKALYRVQLIDKRANISLVDASMNLDLLRNRVHAREQEFNEALEVLSFNNEIHIEWTKDIAVITQTGITSLGSRKYYNQHIEQKRKTILFILKLITFLTIIAGGILSVIKIVEYFGNLP